MNLTGKIVLGVMQMVSICLGVMTISAIVYAVVKLCMGEVPSTVTFGY